MSSPADHLVGRESSGNFQMEDEGASIDEHLRGCSGWRLNRVRR